VKTTGASQGAPASAAVLYNGQAWPVGQQISGRVLRFRNNEILTCPGNCDQVLTTSSLSQAGIYSASSAAGERDLFGTYNLGDGAVR
jgi:hypothetical protein